MARPFVYGCLSRELLTPCPNSCRCPFLLLVPGEFLLSRLDDGPRDYRRCLDTRVACLASTMLMNEECWAVSMEGDGMFVDQIYCLFSLQIPSTPSWWVSPAKRQSRCSSEIPTQINIFFTRDAERNSSAHSCSPAVLLLYAEQIFLSPCICTHSRLASFCLIFD